MDMQNKSKEFRKGSIQSCRCQTCSTQTLQAFWKKSNIRSKKSKIHVSIGSPLSSCTNCSWCSCTHCMMLQGRRLKRQSISTLGGMVMAGRGLQWYEPEHLPRFRRCSSTAPLQGQGSGSGTFPWENKLTGGKLQPAHCKHTPLCEKDRLLTLYTHTGAFCCSLVRWGWLS